MHYLKNINKIMVNFDKLMVNDMSKFQITLNHLKTIKIFYLAANQSRITKSFVIILSFNLFFIRSLFIRNLLRIFRRNF